MALGFGRNTVEITEDGSAINLKYILLPTPSTTIGFYFNNTGVSQPAPVVGGVSSWSEIFVGAGDTTTQVNQAFQSVVNSRSEFKATITGNIVTVYNLETGVVGSATVGPGLSANITQNSDGTLGLVEKQEVIDKFIERVMDFCRSNGTGFDYGISPFQWPSSLYNVYRTFTYVSNVYPGDPGLGNIPSTKAVALEVANMVISFANSCTRIRRAIYRYQRGGNWRYDADRVTSLSTNYLSSLSQTSGSYAITAGNNINATNFLNYIEDIRNQYNTRRGSVAVYFNTCHSNCHGSCHGSRGRR